MGTGLIRTLYLTLNSNGTNVRCCAGTFCREVYRTYILARRVAFLSLLPRILKDSSLSVSLTTCICFGGEVLYRGLYRVRKPAYLFAVWPRCAARTTLVINAQSAQYASQRNECSTQRVQRNKAFYRNRVLETRAHLSRRLPHLVSELPVEIYAERQRSVWAERLEVSLGSEERR